MSAAPLKWISRREIQDILKIDYYRQNRASEKLGIDFAREPNSDRKGQGIVGRRNIKKFLQYFGRTIVESGGKIYFPENDKMIRRAGI